ncbi:AbiJ-NTD4 domain-containing protein [Shewanella algae]|uniref:AbiJ-NTD4 domain-containing protein n=2 Tax=Shewanella algae TaxID=38313 RepID=UPI00165674F7|nr:hypothetical protein [Shewanella algae]MBC8798350.1 hypothetical protein [Shewanella algae]MBO2625258.1 hypothetical protein [Shewanella algae]MBO2688770.1 hypothetical protein [Shewanella algae]BCV29287.1 hypothetical protein TUM3811_31470 [Shewanella algae]HDS1209348.1 hypothetical protein [Shewanella algae]
MEYYSDQINGSQPRNVEVISPSVWGGIVALINGLVASGAFGKYFPEECPDGQGVYATDEQSFKLALCAEVPDIEYPFVTEKSDDDSWMAEKKKYAPNYLSVLDFVQFCYEHVSKPIQGSHHSYFNHYHLSFDCDEGKAEFRSRINRIFSRNGISYELNANGNIIRLAPEILAESLNGARFNTPDSTLNRMLEESRDKFLHPDEVIRRESLERLWDAWERIKTVLYPGNKKVSATLLLEKCASEENFRELLNEEAKKLTDIGNKFHIRHSEVGQIEIQTSAQVDYIFHRLFSFILLASKNLA